MRLFAPSGAGKRNRLMLPPPPAAKANAGVASNAHHVAIFLSTLGLVRGGLEAIAANFARSLAQRNHKVSLVGGAFPGLTLPDEGANRGLHRLRMPVLPVTLSMALGTSPAAQARRLKLHSLSFVIACRVHPCARRLWAAADVTLSFLEIETVYLSRWRAARNMPHVSYFPGLMDRRRIQKDQSHLRLAISHMLATETTGLRIDGVVPPGIDGSWLKQPYKVRARVERLFFCGRLHATKGVWELLRIFAALVQERSDLHLRLAGDGPLRRQLQGWVARSGLQDKVTFLGAISSEDVYLELASADLFLFPTHYESFGVAVLEAQAAGVPVVCSNMPIMKETVGKSALLLPPGDVGRWVEGLQSLLDDQPARQRLSQAGRQNAARYTWERSTSLLEDYLLDVRARV
ncbi:MAG: glycosyltransferase family 4 protein [Chloroflexota bacterium]